MPKRNDLLGWYKLRWVILSRDEYTCQYCGQSAPDVKLEVDHIIPVAEGGTDEPGNLITSCWGCNRGKNGLRQSIVLARAKKQKGLERIATANRQTQVLEVISNNPQGVTRSEIANASGISADNARVVTSRLKRKGLIKQVDNLWLTE